MHCESVNVQVSLFGVNLLVVKGGSVGDTSHLLQRGEICEHISMMLEEGIELLGGGGKFGEHFRSRCPSAVLVEDLIDQRQHHIFAQCLLECISVNHGALESMHQAVVFRKLLQFASDVVWNHEEKPLFGCMMEENMVETVGAKNIEIGFKDQFHVLVNTFNQGIDENIGVDDDQRSERKISKEAALRGCNIVFVLREKRLFDTGKSATVRSGKLGRVLCPLKVHETLKCAFFRSPFSEFIDFVHGW